MRYGYTLPERLQKFNELLLNKQANSITKYDVPSVNGTKLYDVFHVSVELPKYRLDNTRTLALQEQYIYKKNKDEDFFNDVESDEVQEIQHDFLKTLIKSTDKDKDLLNYFSKNTQTEPLILTHDRFVISGNRRLCAYRELLGENMQNYEDFKHFTQIRVVILPNLDQAEIDQIEDFLEQQKDIKEPFSWVSRALSYRKRINRYGYSDEVLSVITGQNKKEIRGLIDKLEIADRYLDDINCPKDYNQILDDSFAFEKVYTCQTKDRRSPAKKASFEKLAFIAIKNKKNFPDRMYKNIPIIQEAQDLIHNEIREQFSTEIETIETELKENSQYIILDLFPDPDISIIKILNTPEHEEKIANIVLEKIDEFVALEREKKKKTSVLERVTKANTLLIEANLIKSDVTDKTGVLNQLKNLQRQIEELIIWAG